MTATTWRSKVSPRDLAQIERLEARGYSFEFSENGAGKEITVRRGDRELGTVSGILVDFVAGEAVGMCGRAEC